MFHVQSFGLWLVTSVRESQCNKHNKSGIIKKVNIIYCIDASRYLLHTVSSVVHTSISHIKTTSLTLCWPPPINSSLTCWGMDFSKLPLVPGARVLAAHPLTSLVYGWGLRGIWGVWRQTHHLKLVVPQAIPEPSFSLHEWVQGLHQHGEVQRVNVTSTSTATGLPLMRDSSDQTPLFRCTVGLFWCSCPPPASWATVAPLLDSITLASLTSVASSPAHSTDREHPSTTMSTLRTKCPFVLPGNYDSKYQSSSISTHSQQNLKEYFRKVFKKNLEWWNRLTVWLEVKLTGWCLLALDPKLSNRSQIQRHKSAESSSCNIGL